MRPTFSLSAVLVSGLVVLSACTPAQPDPEPTKDSLDVILSEERPTKRSEVIAVADPTTDKILMFGGNDAPIVNQIPRAAYLDETWLFQPGFGWSQLEIDAPHARGRHTAALDEANGRALLFGGRFREEGGSGNYDLFDDLWAFDFADETWTQVDDGSGPGPTARYYVQSAWNPSDGALYVYCGLTNSDPLAFVRSDELWRWTEDDGWAEVTTSGDAPSPRAFYGSAFDGQRGRLILFAGQVGDFQSLAYNDLFALDLASGEWTELHNGGSDAPFTRMHPHIQYEAANDRLLLFGGHTDVGDDNDLWEFPMGGDDWRLIREGDRFTGVGFGCLGNPSEVPADYVEQDLSSPERRQKAFVAQLHDNLWLFGVFFYDWW